MKTKTKTTTTTTATKTAVLAAVRKAKITNANENCNHTVLVNKKPEYIKKSLSSLVLQELRHSIDNFDTTFLEDLPEREQCMVIYKSILISGRHSLVSGQLVPKDMQKKYKVTPLKAGDIMSLLKNDGTINDDALVATKGTLLFRCIHCNRQSNSHNPKKIYDSITAHECPGVGNQYIIPSMKLLSLWIRGYIQCLQEANRNITPRERKPFSDIAKKPVATKKTNSGGGSVVGKKKTKKSSKSDTKNKNDNGNVEDNSNVDGVDDNNSTSKNDINNNNANETVPIDSNLSSACQFLYNSNQHLSARCDALEIKVEQCLQFINILQIREQEYINQGNGDNIYHY
jgi:hypothetical protein